MHTQTYSLATDLSPLFAAHVAGHQTNGADWPASSEFALVLRYSAWPVGWSASKHIDFFDTREQLDAKVADLKYYAEPEDNDVAYQGYVWDLGPNKLADVACNVDHL